MHLVYDEQLRARNDISGDRTMNDKICIISGVGPGTGASTARRFAAAGYKVAMLARDEKRLSTLEKEIPNARAFPCDVSNQSSVEKTVEKITLEMGRPEVLIHNAVRGTFGTFLEIEPEDLRQNFDINTMGLLYLSRAVTPMMLERGKGVIIASGNTAALRGKPRFAGFAPTKAAQRILCESMAREIGPQGIHVAYIIIDAVIDLEWTREMMGNKPDDFFIQPDAIADTIYGVSQQDRSAWSFNVEVRPFGEEW